MTRPYLFCYCQMQPQLYLSNKMCNKLIFMHLISFINVLNIYKTNVVGSSLDTLWQRQAIYAPLQHQTTPKANRSQLETPWNCQEIQDHQAIQASLIPVEEKRIPCQWETSILASLSPYTSCCSLERPALAYGLLCHICLRFWQYQSRWEIFRAR